MWELCLPDFSGLMQSNEPSDPKTQISCDYELNVAVASNTEGRKNYQPGTYMVAEPVSPKRNVILDESQRH